MSVSWSIVDSSAKPATTRTEPATRKRFHRPVRVIRIPDTVEDSSSPAIIGMVSRPASVGRVAARDLQVLAEEDRRPNIATPTATLAMMASVVVRSRKSRSGTIGSFARSSVTTKATIASTPPPTNSAVSTEAQAKLSPASVTQISSAETPAVRKAAPR